MGHLVSPRPRGPRRNGRPSARPHPGAFNMADRRDMKWDLAAFGLLLLGLLVALCVFGYDPANVAAGRAFPPEDGTHFLGPLGAWLAVAARGAGAGGLCLPNELVRAGLHAVP